VDQEEKHIPPLQVFYSYTFGQFFEGTMSWTNSKFLISGHQPTMSELANYCHWPIKLCFWGLQSNYLE
jgi:hypothetical protein